MYIIRCPAYTGCGIYLVSDAEFSTEGFYRPCVHNLMIITRRKCVVLSDERTIFRAFNARVFLNVRFLQYGK